MCAYVLRTGEGKIVALYTPCEDESLCPPQAWRAPALSEAERPRP
jgi:hypothetical protein